MRRAGPDEDSYSARYPAADTATQWASYANHTQGLQLPSSNIRGGGSGAVSGYHSAGGGGHGIWMPHGSNNTGGAYPRPDQGIYAHHHHSPGFHSSTSQRPTDQWSDPSGGYGRHSIEFPNSGTSTSQTHWDHVHSRSASYGVTPYDATSNFTSNYHASASTSHHHQPSTPVGETHNYVALPSTPQSTIESYLAPVKIEDNDPLHKSKRAYRCTWVGCTKAARGELFKSKDNARVHVHKHFGSDKLFECVVGSCKKTFASEDAAKRHRDTTESKAFSCAICGKVFARKDYRDVHQRKCNNV